MRPAIWILVVLLLPWSVPPAAADEEPPLRFVLVFHYNQNVVPYARAADDIIYRDLTKLFLRHPELNHTIHVSGVLLDALQWMDPVFLQLLRDGAASGSFEILGSTHAQSLLHSLRRAPDDVGMDANQIAAHRERIAQLLGERPVGFWNAERVWSQELVDPIVDAGYRYTFVEDHIQARGAIQGSEHLVRTTQHDGRMLTVFNDDKTFLNLFDQGVNSGDWAPTWDFLSKLHAEPGSGKYVVVYAQDAEASGLWDFEGGGDPQQQIDHIEAFFEGLKTRPWLRMITPRQALSEPASQDLTPIPTGAADWMGRDRWFEEQDDENLVRYRQLFGGIYDQIADVEGSLRPDQTAARRLVAMSRHTLAAQQYEFADAAHQNNSGLAEWELARSAYSILDAARRSRDGPKPDETVARDVNQDGEDEILVERWPHYYIFTLRGGRLLYWFDLDQGILLTGLKDFNDYGQGGSVEAAHIGDLKGGTNTYSWLQTRVGRPEIFEHVYRMRRASFTDSMTFTVATSAAPISLAGGNVASTWETDDGNVMFHYQLGLGPGMPAFEIDKTFSFLDDGVAAHYEIGQRSGPSLTPPTFVPLQAEFHVEHCLAPDASTAQLGGIDSLGTILDGTHAWLGLDPVDPTPSPLQTDEIVNAGSAWAVRLVPTNGPLSGGRTVDTSVVGGIYCAITNTTVHLDSVYFPASAAFSLTRRQAPNVAWASGLDPSKHVPSFVRAVYKLESDRRIRVPTDMTGKVDAPSEGRYEFESVWTNLAPEAEQHGPRHLRVPAPSAFAALLGLAAVALLRSRRDR